MKMSKCWHFQISNLLDFLNFFRKPTLGMLNNFRISLVSDLKNVNFLYKTDISARQNIAKCDIKWTFFTHNCWLSFLILALNSETSSARWFFSGLRDSILSLAVFGEANEISTTLWANLSLSWTRVLRCWTSIKNSFSFSAGSIWLGLEYSWVQIFSGFEVTWNAMLIS